MARAQACRNRQRLGAKIAKGRNHNGALVHIGLRGALAGLGKKIGAAHADGSNGGVQAVALGLPVRGLTGNLPHRATHQVQVHLGVRAGRIDLVAADDQFAFRAQGHPGLV